MSDFARKFGPWAVVTGASSGIGRAIARELAARHLNIVAIARRATLLADVKRDLEATYDVAVEPLPLDLTAPDAIARIIRATQDKEIGLVVPAAGATSAGAFVDSAPQHNAMIAHLNMIAPMELVRAFSGDMVKRRRGGVLLVSSLFGYQGVPYFAHYAATKAYILVFGEALSHELGKHRIAVTVLSPGLTNTDMPASLPVDFSKLPMPYQSAEQVAKAGVRALGRRTSVVPGFINKFFAWQNRIVPRRTPVWLFGTLIQRALRPAGRP